MMNDMKSEFRDFKLKLINQSYEFKFSTHRINTIRYELDFISKNFPNDIVTGSIALKVYGLLERNISDIDIFISDKDRYETYSSKFYGDVDTNIIGSRIFSYKNGFLSKRKIDVDFFENNGNIPYDVLEFKGIKLKIHNPMDLLSKKIDIFNDSKNSKHLRDLEFIFNLDLD